MTSLWFMIRNRPQNIQDHWQLNVNLPSTCLTQRRAYLRVFNVLDLLLCLFSAGRWSFSSFRILIISFWVLALADSWLLQVAQSHARQRIRYDNVKEIYGFKTVKFYFVNGNYANDRTVALCLAGALTCNRWLKGCPALSSANWRR